MIEKTYKNPGSVLGAIIGAACGGVAVYFGHNVVAGVSIIAGLSLGTAIGQRILRKVKKTVE